MRIAYFTDTYLPEINGVVTSMEAHARMLAGRGHEVLIVCPKYRRRAPYAVPGVTVKRYRSFSFVSNKETRIALPSMTSVLETLVRFRPDVVHVQTPLTIGVVGLAAANTLRVPNVQTYHTYIPDFIKYLEPHRLLRLDDLQDRVLNSFILARGFESEVWQRLMNARENRKGAMDEINELVTSALSGVSAEERTHLPTRVAWAFTRSIYNRANLVLTPSATLKRELEAHGVIAPVEHMSNGVDLAIVSRKVDYSRQGRLLHAGRLGFEKHADVVLDAFARVLERQAQTTLDVVGDGPARESLERQAARLGLGDRVRFPGFMDRAALARTYCRYDAFVTASTIETQGIVLLESMAAGVPVVGVDALAIPELVADGRDGLIVPAGDGAALADAMERMLCDEEFRRRCGESCVADVQQHSLDAIVTRLEGTYARVAGERA